MVVTLLRHPHSRVRLLGWMYTKWTTNRHSLLGAPQRRHLRFTLMCRRLIIPIPIYLFFATIRCFRCRQMKRESPCRIVLRPDELSNLLRSGTPLRHLRENPFAVSDEEADEEQIEAELQELGGQMVGSILDF